ncbi:MAG TPA: hypothetical protein VJN88_16585 [Ktedonobacterales bacterium]|nr:hypothetical protein [Ktedonobacterales bacterium]
MARIHHFEAMLTRPESLMRVRDAQPAVESVGGRIEIQPSGSPDLVLVLLHLPEPYQPDEFLPEIPFFPI